MTVDRQFYVSDRFPKDYKKHLISLVSDWTPDGVMTTVMELQGKGSIDESLDLMRLFNDYQLKGNKGMN